MELAVTNACPVEVQAQHAVICAGALVQEQTGEPVSFAMAGASRSATHVKEEEEIIVPIVEVVVITNAEHVEARNWDIAVIAVDKEHSSVRNAMRKDTHMMIALNVMDWAR